MNIAVIRRWAPLGALLALAACGGGGGSGAPTDNPDGRSVRLAVSGTGELDAYIRDRLRQRPSSAAVLPVAADLAPAAAPAAAAPAFSGTTLQEAGVDEPDLLQTDGSALYALQPHNGSPELQTWRRDADGRAQPLLSLKLPADDAISVNANGMVMSSDAKALGVVSQRWQRSDGGGVICIDVCPPGAAMPLPFWFSSSVAVQRVDVSDPAAASLGARISIDGSLLASRRVGDTLVVVTSHWPRLAVDALPAGASAADREAAIARTTAADVLPRMRRNGGPATALLTGTDCWTQPGNGSTDMRVTTITLFDLKAADLAPRSRCFIGGTEALYMSSQNLYLSTTRWTYATGIEAWIYPPDIRTDIHKFAFGGGEISYRASGTVAGHLGWDRDAMSYRFSEWNGDLRVLSFTGTVGWVTVASANNPANPPSPATLTVLRERSSDQSLQPLATLPSTQHPEALGKAGEQVRAVRFIGDRGYLVTFRSIDPLYVLDLADPAAPRVAGSLEVPGFSDQLLPMADGLLLGVGRDVNASGRLGGVKVALFDTRNPAQPLQLDSLTLGDSGSYTALDASPHGINWLTRNGVARVALPTWLSHASASGYTYERGLQRFEVDLTARSLHSLGLLALDAPLVDGWVGDQRSVQIGDQLYYLHDGTLSTHDW